MRINAAISLRENDIIRQPNQEVSNHVIELLAQEIARQIAVFVRKEMTVNKPGPSMHDPFNAIVQFSIEAELNESDNRRREREYQRMRDAMMNASSGRVSPLASVDMRGATDHQTDSNRYMYAQAGDEERQRQLMAQMRWLEQAGLRETQESILDDMLEPGEE